VTEALTLDGVDPRNSGLPVIFLFLTPARRTHIRELAVRGQTNYTCNVDGSVASITYPSGAQSRITTMRKGG